MHNDRAEVLNRLYQFFSRHPRWRFHRDAAMEKWRSLRETTGEDTEFHSATEDMYYIKSSNIFTDFPVRLVTVNAFFSP